MGLDDIVLGNLTRGNQTFDDECLVEMSDKADEDMLYVGLSSSWLGASLRGQLIGLRDERLH